MVVRLTIADCRHGTLSSEECINFQAFDQTMSAPYAFKHVDFEGPLDLQRCALQMRDDFDITHYHIAVGFFNVLSEAIHELRVII